MSDETTIRRAKRNAPYTMVANRILEDTRLSMDTRWLITYLLSKPDDWVTRIGDIRKKGKCGRDKARAMLSEMEKFGYAKRDLTRRDGKFAGLALVIHDEPADTAQESETGDASAGESVASLPQPEKTGDASAGESVASLPQPEKPAPAKPAPAKPATVQPAPANPPLVNTEELAIPDDSLEREARARARSGDREEGQSDGAAPDDEPGRAAFKKRVMRFCTGRGFFAGAWKDWDTGGAFDWIERQFAALSTQERADAERWRDAYLLDVKDRGKDPQPPGIWLRDRIWTGLEPVLLERLEKRKQARLRPDEQAKPDGWAPMLGPVGMARLFALLLEGPPEGAAQRGAIWLEAQLRDQWPAVHQWKQLYHLRGGTVFGERWHALKEAMEPVPRDTEVLAAWKAEFHARGWPWLAAFDGPKVVFFPAGGPDGLKAFERAVRDAGERSGGEQAGETVAG